ncbi:MAG: DUF2400 domain-containing protein [Thermoplasmata archaeon]|nr:DUF2400 domain-containing protein [Thermoplasmata archaeon]MCI4338126.1 DUF2400 domain-containing protein [Thermoplasmata archaeon]MCI4342223.1 DUF2400 domain-containing protein [Thermoplasmata archaeon]
MQVSTTPSSGLAGHLEELLVNFPLERSLAQDPLSCVRPLAVDRRSAEVAGIYAATLAVGNTTAIRSAFADWLSRCDGDLTGLVDRSRRPSRDRRLREFRHRWIRGDQLAYLAYRLHRIEAELGGLETVFADGSTGPEGFASGLDALARALRGTDGVDPPAGYRALFPSPLGASHSPCKRLALFLRWMVREEYPDLGVWKRVPLAELRIPLDQHVFWISYHMGLTRRRTRSWAAVEEVTARLREFDPVDPVRYDFALCHTGISGDCPKERDISVCGACRLRPDCLLWHPRRGRAA